MSYSRREIRPRTPEVQSDERITEDFVPSMKDRMENLMKFGSRLELHRLAENIIQHDGESEEAYEARIAASVERVRNPVYMPDLDEIADIFTSARAARERAQRQAELAEAGSQDATGESDDSNTVSDGGDGVEESTGTVESASSDA